jgi:predicted nucleotidyltransferase
MELMTVLGLSEELSELLVTRVDVVTIRALRPELRRLRWLRPYRCEPA